MVRTCQIFLLGGDCSKSVNFSIKSTYSVLEKVLKKDSYVTLTVCTFHFHRLFPEIKNLVNYDLHTKFGNFSLTAKLQEQSSIFLGTEKSGR